MHFFAQINKVALNVKDFGASPSATAAQNNVAIAAAIAAIPASGGTVIFPESGYFVSQSIIIDKDNVCLFGFGQRGDASVIAVDPSADPTYLLIVGNTKNVNSCLLSGLAFIGKNSGTSTGNGILFRSNGGKMFQVRTSLFGGNGMFLSSFAGTNFEIFLEDVELVQNGMNSTTHGDNLIVDSTVSDCEFHRVISSGDNARTTTRYGYSLLNGAGNCKFIDCHAYYCTSYGMLNLGVGTQVIGGEWENNVGTGIGVSSNRCTIMGATFNLNGNTDISLFAGPSIVTGNQCSSTLTFANIYADSNAGGVIADNICSGCPIGLQLDTGASQYDVHDNNFSQTSTIVIETKSTNSHIHDNIIQGTGGGGIVEQTGAQGNNIHDNLLIGGGTITQVGTTTEIRNNPGFNPRGLSVTQPAVPATTVAVTNTTGVDCTVLVKGGTLTAILVGGSTTGITAAAAAGSAHSLRVPVRQTISITYTVAPTWTWFGD